MADQITDLMEQVYDHFFALYQQGASGAAEDVFLAFQPIGTPMTPNMFRIHPSDASFSPALAVEQFSLLSNHVASAVAGSFSSGGKVVDDFYNMLLLGSQPLQGEGDELFIALKAHALQTFDQQKLGSLLQGIAQFHPAYATPNDWYDPAVQAGWSSYSTGNQDQTLAPAGQTAPSRPALSPWTWRVAAESVRPALGDTRHLAAVLTNPDAPAFAVSSREISVLHAFSAGAIASDRDAAASEAVQPVAALHLSALSAPMTPAVATEKVHTHLSPGMLEALGSVAAEHTVSGGVEHAVAIHGLDAVATVDPPDPAPASGAVQFIDSDVLAVIMTQVADTSTPQPVTSHSMTLSFQYALVSIARPWFSEAFLNTPGWFVPAFAAGAFSTGAADETNTGIMPAVPVACLLVKDLAITANWSGTDLTAAQQSAGLGPFSLLGRTITMENGSQVLRCPGAQIVGWVCEVLPKLPPADPPA